MQDSSEPSSTSTCTSTSSPPSESPQIDVILSPFSLLDFHAANLSRNSDHYSTSLLPASAVSSINALGPGLWFNPYCSIVEGGKTYVVKYGVVQKDRLVDDLREWSSFYAAGRMQKPTLGIIKDGEVAAAQKRNLESAVLAALVVNSGALPAGQNEVARPALYGWIAGLSYMGDIRVSVGFEDPKKVSKLTTSAGAPER